MSTYIPSPLIAITAATDDPAITTTVERVAPPRTVRIAAFTCTGLDHLSRTLGFRVAVVAATSDPARHMRQLGDLWYASGVAMPKTQWFEPFDFDFLEFREWRQIAMDERWFGTSAHPLSTCVDDGSLLIRLPKGVARDRYASTFRDGVAGMRFEVVARHPSRCVRRFHTGRPVVVNSRYARASAVDATPVEVRDVIAFEPRVLSRIADVAFMTLVRLIATTAI